MTEGMEGSVREAVERAHSNGCIVIVPELASRIACLHGGNSDGVVDQVVRKIMEEATRAGVAMEFPRAARAA
ncbi:hypothetical protein [Consotaella salsifontis]|uniref:Uncharacterized protein n=1 Tax=Consotaella salsifontis TaxID=1365950 RepID=A0A1T4P9U8_9HYPH|nr:hypothetical protein [Consotaella salsifontis]SJZ88229.1 hypothetical protein SAMN05428963_103411 [Consotaella salsifontis]